MAKTERDPFIGATVIGLRRMTAAEAKREGWDLGRWEAPMVAVLSTGALLYASRDDEGNGPGQLFGFDGQNTIGFRPVQKEG